MLRAFSVRLLITKAYQSFHYWLAAILDFSPVYHRGWVSGFWHLDTEDCRHIRPFRVQLSADSKTVLKYMHFEFVSVCTRWIERNGRRGCEWFFAAHVFPLQTWVTIHQLLHFLLLSRTSQGKKYKPSSRYSSFGRELVHKTTTH